MGEALFYAEGISVGCDAGGQIKIVTAKARRRPNRRTSVALGVSAVAADYASAVAFERTGAFGAGPPGRSGMRICIAQIVRRAHYRGWDKFTAAAGVVLDLFYDLGDGVRAGQHTQTLLTYGGGTAYALELLDYAVDIHAGPQRHRNKAGGGLALGRAAAVPAGVCEHFAQAIFIVVYCYI